MLAAGDLRERVTIQQRGVSLDSIGENTAAWTDVATVWANAEPLRGASTSRPASSNRPSTCASASATGPT